MKLKIIAITLFLILSCNSADSQNKTISQVGFYWDNKKIVKKYSKSKDYRIQYLCGIAEEKNRNFKNAIFHFTSSCFKYSKPKNLKIYPQPVYQYIKSFHIKSKFYFDSVYKIAKIFFLYNEIAYTIKFLELIPESKHYLYFRAQLLKASAFKKDREYAIALKILTELSNKDFLQNKKSIIYLRIASIYSSQNRYQLSQQFYIKVLQNKTSWATTIAAKKLLQIMQQSNFALSKKDLLLVANALHQGNLNKEALYTINKIINLREDELTLKIKILVSLKKFSLCKKIIKKQNSLLLNKAYADTLWQHRKRSRALPIYLKIFPRLNFSLQKNVLFKICFQLKKRHSKDFYIYAKSFIKNYPNDSKSEYLRWELGRNYLKTNQLKTAKNIFEHTIKIFPTGKNSSKIKFWLYKIYNTENNKKKATAVFKDLVVNNPDSSYTWQLLGKKLHAYKTSSLKKLFNQSVNKKNRTDMLFHHSLLFYKNKNFSKRNKRISIIKKTDYKNFIFGYDKITKLDISSDSKDKIEYLEKFFEVGDIHSISNELNFINEKKNIDLKIGLVYLAQKYNISFIAIKNLNNIFKLQNKKTAIALLPKQILKILFPKPFYKCVVKNSKKYKLTVPKIYSIIKAESFFNHRATSPAGAMGLMQLMPATAKGIAKNLKIKTYSLKNPCTSITFGTKYLAWLKRFFKNDYNFMVAGYNAGAGNVKKWQKKIKFTDRDFFIEFIPFDETKFYILRTNKFLQQYKIIYNQ